MRLLVLASLVLTACGATASAPAPAPVAPVLPPQHPASRPPLLGPVTREQVLGEPKWRETFEAAQPNPEAATALAQVPPGAAVEVYLGTWCSDSRREVSRLWKALDQVGTMPFTLTSIGVDRQKHGPGVTEALDLHKVPTFVVKRNGHEVGRIVEHAPRGIETELAELLRAP